MKRIFSRAAWGMSIVTLLSASLLLPVAAQTNAPAKTSNGYQISPVRSEYTIEKGKSDTLTISIQNPSEVATTAKAIVNNFVASEDESGTPRLVLADNAQPPKNNFKTLISDIPDVTLASKEKKDIPVKITVPASANSGGYYGAVRFVPANATQESTVGLTASVGTIVLVTVPGDLKLKLDVVQLSASQNGKPKSFITSGDVDVLTRLKNSGDIHLKPFGRVTVKNMFGKIVASYEFNNKDPRANILPDSIRKFEDPLGKHSLLGRYTIESNLGYSTGGGDLLTAKSSFWYVPVWAVLVLIVLLLVIIGGIYWLVRKLSGASRSRK